MYKRQQDNLKALRHYGWDIIEPADGLLACGAIGKGKMPEEDEIIDHLLRVIACEKDLTGKKVLVTAGPTREALDPIRYISNHSTGKMGYSLAKMAMLRGAEVTLVTGPVNLEPPRFVNAVHVHSAEEMYEAVMSRATEQDAMIMAAAVADYRPKNVASEKIKKMEGDAAIPLERTKDILASAGANRRENQFLCGFSMETENMLENSRKKLIKKNVDMIVANNLRQEGAGFGTDTNIVTLIQRNTEEALPQMSKDDVAMRILDIIARSLK